MQAITTAKHVKLVGFYTHNSQSYNASSPGEAFAYLESEISCGRDAVSIAQSEVPELKSDHLTVSVGATPSVSSVQNLLSDSEFAQKSRSQLDAVRNDFDLELHAGVYTTLDLQQVATGARPARAENKADVPSMTTDDIGLRVLAEVLSVYSERSAPEALIGAGTLALGREPCKSYPGWAIIAPSPWKHLGGRHETRDDDDGSETASIYSEDHRRGWIVDRVSQEHGILTWHDDSQTRAGKDVREHMASADGLAAGEKVLLWPNHACITGAGFAFYLVVDSEAQRSDCESHIIDVWVRARGW